MTTEKMFINNGGNFENLFNIYYVCMYNVFMYFSSLRISSLRDIIMIYLIY